MNKDNFQDNFDIELPDDNKLREDYEKSKQCSFGSAENECNQSEIPLLAIDGGGTQTLVVITDAEGKLISSGESGTSNYHVSGIDAAVNALKTAIIKAIQRLPKSIYNQNIIFETGVFALAGIDTKQDEENVYNIVYQAIEESNIAVKNLILENDALSVLLGSTQFQPGAILISGTGSIAYAHDGKNKYTRAGGWGHRIGDEGSGYWIGREGIKAVLRSFDGRGPETILSDLVMDYLKLNDHEELYNWIYGPDYSAYNVGMLSSVVELAYNNGDLISKHILDSAVNELYQLVNAVTKKANIAHQSHQLFFLGGVLENSKYIKENLISHIKRNMPNVSIGISHENPIKLIVERGLINLKN